MARGKPHSEEVRAAVMAALVQGQSITAVSEQFKLPLMTVSDWANSDQFVEVRSLKKERISELLLDYLEEWATTMRDHVKFARKESYIETQPASEFAVLHGVIADKGFRVLESLAQQESETGESDSED